MYTVYILKSQVTHKHYIGCTNNLERRFQEHNAGHNYSTKKGCPWELIYYKHFDSQEQAYACEKKIKSFKGGNAFKKLLEEWQRGRLHLS
jgi:putative endonuclease